jgi:hypothetical protein
MEPVFPIAAAAAFFLILPWIVCLFKRLKMAAKLRMAAKSNGWTLRPLHPLWFLGTNGTSVPDCLFEGTAGGRRRIYSVKLWASLCRMQNAYFIGTDPQTVRYRRIVPLAGRFAGKYDWELNEIAEGTGGGINLLRESREKKREPVDYRYRCGGGAEVIPVLLFCPAPLNVAEARVVPLTHTTVERLPMFTKAAETTLETRRLFDGDLLHEREYVFGTEAFLGELKYPHIGV